MKHFTFDNFLITLPLTVFAIFTVFVVYANAQEAFIIDEPVIEAPVVVEKVEAVVNTRLSPRERDEAKQAQRSPTEREDETLRQLKVMNNTLLRIEAKLQ